jgi:hypothetical protein
MQAKKQTIREFGKKIEGRILPPLILWMLGVPGGVVLVLWFFFFRD